MFGKRAVQLVRTVAALRQCTQTRRGLQISAQLCKSEDQTSASKRFKIYTRTGDKGTSLLYSGERKSKDDVVFMALGSTDELSSFIGVSREHCLLAGNKLETQLEEIQCRLQELGSHIATPRDNSSHSKINRTEFSESHVDVIESWIDEMDEHLPPLTTFILPSGGFASASLHCCRSICRRAERDIVPLVASEQIDGGAYKFVNRLSDYFFTAARFAAVHENKPEVIFRPTQKSKDV
eukprot:m.89057 g.89057  ORF g.89057 m.89057 type:complete len:237 (-) comp26257_c0_seq3:42-752(-)